MSVILYAQLGFEAALGQGISGLSKPYNQVK